ncbi:non-specific phospholipase C2-like [Eucalyptus grandis]|uniref:non-specific phospholipase C2-like n=1 Tax=Eucalyptus grandis TaxID=71139 RepID=UPI00192EA599|nr:non-specific phospholipase C2-like [Eucalyptus grandis]
MIFNICSLGDLPPEAAHGAPLTLSSTSNLKKNFLLLFRECLTGRKATRFLRPPPTFLLALLLTATAVSFSAHAATTQSPIRTVVVLVMENRSFDHMLGWMKRLNPAINGVNGSESNLLSTSDPKSPGFYFDDRSHYVDPDPGHSFQASREQIFGSDDTSVDPPPMDGFAQQAYSMDPSMNMSRDVMSGFNPDMVAVYKALVSEFAVFDRWFVSVPSSTQPNRLYVHSGTSAGATSNIPALLIRGYPQCTIFENLGVAGLSFGIIAVVHGPNRSPFPTSEYQHSSIPATLKKLFNLSAPFLTRRDAWAGTFEGIVQTRTQPKTDCPEQLPTPNKIGKGEANEDAEPSEFQQELLQLAAVLKGDHIFTSYPERLGKEMTVREGKEYMEDAVKSFFEAGLYAKKMGVDGEQIVKMRPSLTTRPSNP